MSRPETPIAILGDRNPDYSPHYAMQHYFSNRGLEIEWIPTPTLEADAAPHLNGFRGIIAGSGPYQSKQGVINGIRYARLNNIPFIGSCSGFGYAVLELGQSLTGAAHVLHPGEGLEIPSGEDYLQRLNHCSAAVRPIRFELVPGTLTSRIYRIYGPAQEEQVAEALGRLVAEAKGRQATEAQTVQEESHCAYGINQAMIRYFAGHGLIVAALDHEKEPKIMEYTPNDFFIIMLFLPQWLHSRTDPHPLLEAFLEKAVGNKTAMAWQ
ncbi:MAG: hypothetical protein P4L51_01370 [Puia sp.]|nr:hypothetical protein [Puia sp.]